MEIRRATPEDLPRLISIQRETQDLHFAADPTFFRQVTDEELQAAMREFLAEERTVVWIAWREDEPAGFLVFKFATAEQNRFCHARADGLIDQLAVGSRFRRQGIGRALMAHAERHAVSLDCREMRLGVLASNTVARDFYKSLAFVPTLERWRKFL